MNKIILIGRLTRDPELKYLNDGKAVTKFTLAVDRGYQDKTDFIRCETWGKTAENTAEYMEKGRMCAVEGELNIDKYEDKYYTKVNCNRVVFLGGNSDKPKNEKVEDNDLDDDDFQIPF